MTQFLDNEKVNDEKREKNRERTKMRLKLASKTLLPAKYLYFVKLCN